MPRSLTRRAFLGQASCAAVGSLGLLSTLLNLRMANSAVAQTLEPGEDYRALVCLFFAGGMDSYNLLLPGPAAGSAYDNYVVTRGGTYDAVANVDGLALSAASILPLAAHASDPFGFGVHPRCADDGARPGMASLYGQGDLAFVANVGTLAERLTKATYNNSTGRRPSGLYSHSDQVQQWHTSVATEARTIGWAGRAADLLHAGNTSARVSMNISLAGNNVWQTGTGVFNYNISSTGSSLPSDYNSPYATPVVSATSRSAVRTAAIDNLLQQEYQNLLDRTFTQNLRDSIETSAAFKDAFDAATLATTFPGDAGHDLNSKRSYSARSAALSSSRAGSSSSVTGNSTSVATVTSLRPSGRKSRCRRRFSPTFPPTLSSLATRLSSVPYSVSHFTAVLGPHFSTPGTLSTVSPTSAR